MLLGFALSAYWVRERKKLHESDQITTAIPMKPKVEQSKAKKEEVQHAEERDSFLGGDSEGSIETGRVRSSSAESPEGWRHHI